MAPTPPTVTTVAIQAPYEGAIIAGLNLISKLIDGQTADQKAQIWQGWIDFWKPFNSLISKL